VKYKSRLVEESGRGLFRVHRRD